MMRTAICVALFAAASVVSMGLAAQSLKSNSQGAPGRPLVAIASEAGAALDSDLLRGGGTDDTRALQAVLDRAARGAHVHLVIDGPALVSGLEVYSDTTVECRPGGGFYLKNEAKRAIIRNANRTRGAIKDRNIAIRGCFLNGNRANQSLRTERRPDLGGMAIESPQDEEGTFIAGLQFAGIRDLVIEDVTLYSMLTFSSWVSNAHNVVVRKVSVDRGEAPPAAQTDGLFFSGPVQYLNIDDVIVRTGDDAICLCANNFETNDVTRRNDLGPYVGQGPITDVTITNVQFRETLQGIRLLSSDQRIDRISISNVSGIVTRSYAFTIGHWTNPTSFGNYGSISISNVNLDRMPTPPEVVAKIKDPKWGTDWAKEFNDGRIPFLNVNSPIEILSLQNIVTKVLNDDPVVRFGPDARVAQASVELAIHDAGQRAVPIELDAGAIVRRLDLALGWTPPAGHPTGKPILSEGGTVETLNWLDRAADNVAR